MSPALRRKRRHHPGIFKALQSALSLLLLVGTGLAVGGTALSSSGCGDTVVKGDPPAADAEMKTIVINVFGMT